MKQLSTILVFLFISKNLLSNELVLQFKCEGVLRGVTIDSRNDNKKRNDSISDKGDILISFFDNEINANEPKLNFKWGKEDRKIKFTVFGKGPNAIHFDGNTIVDKDGYNLRDYHLNLDTNSLYYTRTTVRGIFGPHTTTTSVYVTNCENNLPNSENNIFPDNIAPDLPGTG